MANILEKITQIRQAVFGKDVRGSIADGIYEINKEVESTTGKQKYLEDTFNQLVINAGSSNAEIVDARVDKTTGKSYTKVGERLDEVSSHLADIMNKYYIVTPLGVNEAALQEIINNLQENDTLEIRGTFDVNYLSFIEKKKIKITGNATINYLVNDLSACFDVFNIEDSIFEGITFKGHKDKVGALTSFVDNKNFLIKLGLAKNTVFRDCKFIGHTTRCIQVNSVKGYWADEGITIEKCWFEDMLDLNSNQQCCIQLEPSAQYSNILNNTFVNVKSAVHNFGANNRINFNNITNCTLTNTSLLNYEDIINYRQAHIFSGQLSATDNQSKVQIFGNKINHITGNFPAIMCVGNITTNENYYDVKDNEILVNNAPYDIILANTSGAKTIGNSIGRNGGTENLSRILLYNSELTFIDGNYFIGDVVPITLVNSTMIEGNNTTRFKATKTNYKYLVKSGLTRENKRFTKENIGFAFIANGTVADWLSNLVGISVVKNSAGSYTVNHGLGHQQYVVQGITEGNNGIIQISNRLTNSFNITVVDMNGNPLDTTVVGDIKLLSGGYHNIEMCGW